MKYQRIDEPAENINALLEHLKYSEGNDKYIYRGQVKEWPGPFIPSLYRRFITYNRTFTDKSRKFKLSLRRCGRRFVKVMPDSLIAKIVRKHRDLKSEEYDVIMKLADNLDFSIILEEEGWEAAISRAISPSKRDYVRKRIPIWQEIIDELHRGRIRHLGFLQPFGFMLGMTLAQQYGFSSEFLDFTSDLNVAAFFATHNGPHYIFEGTRLSKAVGSVLGVIYRLPSTEGEIKHKRIDAFDYYNCPPQLHMSEVCMRFEDKSAPKLKTQWLSRTVQDELSRGFMLNGKLIADEGGLGILDSIEKVIKRSELPLKAAIDKYLQFYYMGGGTRYYQLLDMSPGTFAQSRLGRQMAVLIVCDELRKTVKPKYDEHYATFQAIEDVSHRDGFERFYFRHTDSNPCDGKIDRELLWPKNNDSYKMMISRVIDPTSAKFYFMGDAIPKRLSLVSEGYE